MRNFMDLSRALKGLADAFHTIKLKLDGLYDSTGAIGNQFELIEEITLTEDAAVIERTTTPDNVPYSFSDIIIMVNTPNTSANTFNVFCYLNEISDYFLMYQTVTANTAKYCKLLVKNINGIFDGYSLAATGLINVSGTNSQPHVIPAETITKIVLSCPGSFVLPTDTKVLIYAVKK